MAPTVGFIGLGNIGLPMARNLLEGGFSLVVHDLRNGPLEELCGAGATRAASVAELAREVDITEVCVRDDAQVEAVLLGPDGVLENAAKGTLVAVHSTIRPATIESLATEAAARGIELIDAPITGGAIGAATKRLCYMVGGSEAAVERCRAAFETSASTIVHTGAVGTGAKTKLCNNVMGYLGFLSAFEGTRLAESLGLERERLLEVTRANGVLTEPMEAYLGLRGLPEEQWQDEGFLEMVRGLLGLAEKDLGIALECAREAGLELGGADRCRELMARVYGLEGRKKP